MVNNQLIERSRGQLVKTRLGQQIGNIPTIRNHHLTLLTSEQKYPCRDDHLAWRIVLHQNWRKKHFRIGSDISSCDDGVHRHAFLGDRALQRRVPDRINVVRVLLINAAMLAFQLKREKGASKNATLTVAMQSNGGDGLLANWPQLRGTKYTRRIIMNTVNKSSQHNRLRNTNLMPITCAY
jgi:hypothetical protein